MSNVGESQRIIHITFITHIDFDFSLKCILLMHFVLFSNIQVSMVHIYSPMMYYVLKILHGNFLSKKVFYKSNTNVSAIEEKHSKENVVMIFYNTNLQLLFQTYIR